MSWQGRHSSSGQWTVVTLHPLGWAIKPHVAHFLQQGSTTYMFYNLPRQCHQLVTKSLLGKFTLEPQH